jgi:hypothetical protein
MNPDNGHINNPFEAFMAVILTAFASVLSWQEQAEWGFRILSLILACTVSIVVLVNHYKKANKKKA